MDTHKLDAQKVTKPIQLLAAWLIGLILIDVAFLTTAIQLDERERWALILACIFNVPVFLGAMFMLQTKFRPELQEDAFYSKYLDSKTNQVVTKSKFEAIDSEIGILKQTIMDQAANAVAAVQGSVIVGDLGRRNKIGLNSRLRDFERIRALLREKNIRLNDIFGATASSAPTGRYMAIDAALDHESKLEAIKLAFECDLDGYGYFNPGEEDIQENILIGSYGLESNHIRLSTGVRAVVDAHLDPVDLKHEENQARNRQPQVASDV